MVAGRTYRLTYDIHVSAFTKGTLSVGLSTDATPAVMSSAKNDYTATNGSGATATLDFVYAAADHEMITIYAAANTVLTVDFDNFSLKEVGTATGWTDADQQLHIPQTALQSYNQLAWFDGVADYTSITNHDDFSFGNGSSDSEFSISAWIYMNDATTFPIVSKYSTSHKEWFFKTDGSDKLKLRLYDNSTGAYQGREYDTALTSYEGKWTHVVATYSGDETDAEAGINLYINGGVVDDADSSSGSYTAMENKDGAVTIGAELAGTSKFANGAITEVSIWADNLTQAEVNELYNDGKALDATTHSAATNIKGYWRNNGLATWTNLNDSGTHDGTPTSLTETMLIPAGVDATRDNQGFIMNRQKDTSCLNLIDEDNSYVDVGTYSGFTFGDASNDSAFSVSAWIKVPDLSSLPIIAKAASSNREWVFVFTSSDELSLYLYDENISKYESMKSDSGFASTDQNTWINVAATYDGTGGSGASGGIKLYRNGVALGLTEVSTATYVAMEALEANVRIGSWEAGSAYTDGQIDNVLLYNKELSAAEVLRNYNAGKGSHRN